MMDAASDSTHISPIFWDLLTRRYLLLSGLGLIEHVLYPPRGYLVTRWRYAGPFTSWRRSSRETCFLATTTS
jgi:hypothetical protein